MFFDGLGTKKLLDKLSEKVPQGKQLFFADDGSSAGTLNELKD